MQDGELKVAAFTVFLNRLLSEAESGTDGATGTAPGAAKREKQVNSKRQPQPPPESLQSRILGLREEGFFSSQRGLAEIRAELAKHGWHYPVTTLSGAMQSLVRNKELRREQVAGEAGKKKIWKYSKR